MILSDIGIRQALRSSHYQAQVGATAARGDD